MTGYTTQGIHMDPILSYVDKTKDRWTRTCSVCGKQQHTYDNPNPKPQIKWNN